MADQTFHRETFVPVGVGAGLAVQTVDVSDPSPTISIGTDGGEVVRVTIVPDYTGVFSILFNGDLPAKDTEYDLWGDSSAVFPVAETSGTLQILSSEPVADAGSAFIVLGISDGASKTEIVPLGVATVSMWTAPLMLIGFLGPDPNDRSGVSGLITATIGGAAPGGFIEPGQGLSKTGFRRVPPGKGWRVKGSVVSATTALDPNKETIVTLWQGFPNTSPVRIIDIPVTANNPIPVPLESSEFSAGTVIFLTAISKENAVRIQGSILVEEYDRP